MTRQPLHFHPHDAFGGRVGYPGPVVQLSNTNRR
jgi:hypothetical protein